MDTADCLLRTARLESNCVRKLTAPSGFLDRLANRASKIWALGIPVKRWRSQMKVMTAALLIPFSLIAVLAALYPP
jgi:hypothetical protein